MEVESTAVALAVTGSLAAGAAALCGVLVGVLIWSRSVQQERAVQATTEHVQPKVERGGSCEQTMLTRRQSSKLSVEEDDPMSKWEGFTMAQAREHADIQQSISVKKTPADVLAELQKGNTRFWRNKSLRHERTAFQRRALICKQYPSVAILGCADSRVPTEIVFDQGLGDIFVVRVAGNALMPSTLASLQYAVHHLKVKVVMVLGHEMCGAVKASMLPTESLKNEPVELQRALAGIKAGLDAESLKHVQDARAHDREAVATNVRKQVEGLTRDDGIMAKVKGGEVMIVGAFYEISSGIVDFFQEVTAPPSGVAPTEQDKRAER